MLAGKVISCGRNVAFMLTYCRTYHEYVNTLGNAYAAPDLAIAFNSGCGSVNPACWLPTLKLLVQRKIPSVFTVGPIYMTL